MVAGLNVCLEAVPHRKLGTMVRGRRRTKAPQVKTRLEESDFQDKLPFSTPIAKITSYFNNDLKEDSTEIPARMSPRKQPSTMTVLQQPNCIVKRSPHRIEMKPEEVQNKRKTQKARRKVNQETKSQDCKNSKLTDYFPVRRSVRKTKKTVLEERQKNIENAVICEREDGLEVHVFPNKGRGIIATRAFARGDYVVEYAGELITSDEAKTREALYAQDQNTGCYMYYFVYKNTQYCVDATPESKRLGRLVNHSRNGNLITKTVLVGDRPRLVLIANQDINVGDELTYDYGDRSKESLRHHPWLAT
ncbi:SET domain containing 8 isoform X2 [Rhodnius prolixus]|uniref:[histone H4]-lysine(20) N-methyltransferase n=4 Tax=Rhodnius TaxID=13248 RepID=R4FML7_RHOPR